MSAARARRLAVVALTILAGCFDPSDVAPSNDASADSSSGLESLDTSTGADDDTTSTDTGTSDEAPDPDTSTTNSGCPRGVFGAAAWGESCWG